MRSPILFFVCWVVLNIVIVTCAVGQTAKPPKRLSDIAPLERIVDRDTNLTSNRIDIVAMKSFSWTSTIGGFAMLFKENDSAKENFAFTPKSLRFRDLLDSIVAAEPRYQWKEKDGIINLIPKDNYPVLEASVARFSLKNATKEEMINGLQSTTEFLSATLKAGVQKNLGGSFDGICTETPQKNTINIYNATVQEILNEIVRLNGLSVWRYREYSVANDRTKGRFYSLDFIVNHGADCSAL